MDATNNSTQGTDYHDFHHATESQAMCLEDAASGGGNSLSSAMGANTISRATFAARLHYMLSELEKDGLDHIVGWCPHGRAFIVQQQEEFVEKVLPLWFRQSKFASFQRQLNLYGFSRITSGPDKHAYWHELFLRGKEFLAQKIKRMKVKGQGARKPSAPELEPDFYSMPQLPLMSSTAASRATTTRTAQVPVFAPRPFPESSSAPGSPIVAPASRVLVQATTGSSGGRSSDDAIADAGTFSSDCNSGNCAPSLFALPMIQQQLHRQLPSDADISWLLPMLQRGQAPQTQNNDNSLSMMSLALRLAGHRGGFVDADTSFAATQSADSVRTAQDQQRWAGSLQGQELQSILSFVCSNPSLQNFIQHPPHQLNALDTSSHLAPVTTTSSSSESNLQDTSDGSVART